MTLLGTEEDLVLRQYPRDRILDQGRTNTVHRRPIALLNNKCLAQAASLLGTAALT